MTVAELLSPKGRLDPAVLFPGQSSTKVNQRLAAYLEQAELKASGIADADDQEVAIAAYVYYLAFDAVYQRLVMMPASVSATDEGGSSYLADQIERMANLRDEALAEFEVLDPVAISEGVYRAQTSLR